jgi:hypothetical protein
LIDFLVESYVLVPTADVVLFAFPDLSTHWETVAPFAGITPVPAGSAPGQLRVRGMGEHPLRDPVRLPVLREDHRGSPS